MSVSHLMVEDANVEAQVERMLSYLSEAVKMCYVPLYTYVTQRLVVGMDTNGHITNIRARVEPAECLDMIRVGQYGRA